MFLKGHQSLPGLPNYLRFDVVCDNLGSQKFWKYLERVAILKSLRTPALICILVGKEKGDRKEKNARILSAVNFHHDHCIEQIVTKIICEPKSQAKSNFVFLFEI